jgi:malonyl-CoA/methylmalonyl-CoA synthetase
MYTRLIQGYVAMDPELQAASASAARQLRLMVGRKCHFLRCNF